MRIAQIAPLIERVPPKTYGGTERVVHALTEELVARGHEVTLFASGDSITSARLSSVFPQALRAGQLDIYATNVWTLLNIGAAYNRQDEFDIIHDHGGIWSIATANVARTPVVMTMHGPLTSKNRQMFQKLRNPALVTISDAQAVVPGLNYAGTVYNGLHMEHYPFSAEHDGYLLFVGRISEEKGVHNAIELAQRANLPLIIAAKLDPVNQGYFDSRIRPHLSERIRWIGEVSQDERNQLMSRALAFVHAITWREPFGLTLIEAMACGAPVIAVPLGSIPEIVIHGTNGFLANNVDEMVEAVEKLPQIDRSVCRRYALEAFSAKRMADNYERIYRRLIAQRSSTPRSTPVSGTRAALS